MEVVDFLLPLEIVEMLCRLGNIDHIWEQCEMDELTKAHVESVSLKEGAPFAGVGLHGDGVPCNCDRAEAVEVVSLNLPGISGRWKPIRIPLVALPHSRISKNT